MPTIIDRLPASALPFVTRSLRGGRGRRFAALSFGLALLTLLTCLWIGLGEGRGAREMRVSLGMEEATYVFEHREFVLVDVPDEGWILESRKQSAIDQARKEVYGAIAAYPFGHVELQNRAKALADTWNEPRSSYGFSWENPGQVARLEKIVERGGVPAIVEYTPVLGLVGTMQLLAIVTGGLLIVLFTIVAPLLVALQQATERNENTLQPLTGTALGARELAVGLACGPLAIVAIFAAPLAALYVLATVITGSLEAFVLLPVVAGTAIGLVFGAQLLAHLAGAQRAPGLIAVGLLMLLALVGLTGLGLSTELRNDVQGLTAVFPHAGALAMLGDCFGEPWRAVSQLHYDMYRHTVPHTTLDEFLMPTLVGTLGAAVLGLLALRALTRQIEGRPTLLELRHALLGALVCITMIDVAIPFIEDGEPFHQVLGLPALAMPFLLLIMARVPLGDVPTKLRRIPLARLLAEFGGWTLLHLIVAAALDRTAAGFHPMVLLGVAWCVLVLVLVAARLAATPGTILGHVWTLVCLGMIPMTYATACIWAFEPDVSLSNAGDVPGLATIWLAMLVWVPISLVRHLRKHVEKLG